MNPLRKVRHDGLAVAYTDQVSEEQVRRVDELVHDEFESGDWVVVEQED